jgi:ectoine hydroxylase-related dioxygenase (phytanoyl-CoA dioxygenase family)
MPSEVQQHGFMLVPNVVRPSLLDGLITVLGPVSGAGRRGMLSQPIVRELAVSAVLMNVISPHLEGKPRPVRAIYFDKSPGASWIVPWHQDLTISVTHRVETVGFGPWSTKDGLIHVQPPAEILEGMITLRIHLDDADESNGALKVLPGSHNQDRLNAQDIERFRSEVSEVMCCAKRGDGLLMRPLLLHASGHSTSERNRRILHIEYAAADLPNGLEWNHMA